MLYPCVCQPDLERDPPVEEKPHVDHRRDTGKGHIVAPPCADADVAERNHQQNQTDCDGRCPDGFSGTVQHPLLPFEDR